MKIETVIFDFDGTLAASTGHFLQIAIKLAPEFKIDIGEINEESIMDFKKKSYREIMRHFGIKMIQIPKITKRFREEFLQSLDEITFFPGIDKLIKTLKLKNLTTGILTSNSIKNVNIILKNNQLDLFDFIYESKILGQKAKILKKIIKKHHLNPKTTIYIGDEIRDIEAAQKAGVLSAGVAWGFNDISSLKVLNPDLIILEPQDLLKSIN